MPGYTCQEITPRVSGDPCWYYRGSGYSQRQQQNGKWVNACFSDIFSVCDPKPPKFYAALPRTIRKMATKYEVDRVSGSRVMRGTDRQTDTQTDVPCIIR